MQNRENQPIIIAMDIDNFLTTMEITDLRKKNRLDPVHHKKEYFINVTFEYNDNPYEVENLLTPGCVEFLKFLFESKNIRPAFFSSGIRERNLDLGKKMVQLLINTGGDPEWINRYDVYSREDCLDTERLPRHSDNDYRDQFQPKHFFGNYKKDLRMIYYGREIYHEMTKKMFKDPDILLPVPEKDSKRIENIILIEEDSSYVLRGQEKNMLLCPTYRHSYPYPVNYQKENTPDEPDNWRNNFKTSNTLFYAAGVLNQTFKRYFSEEKSIPDILWEEQGHIWVNRDHDNRFPTHFFTEGRKILRKYNPELNFVVPGNK